MSEKQEIVWQLILNPHAGGGKGAKDRQEIVKLLRDSGILFHLSVSQFPGHAIELARQLTEEGHTQFLIAGGDGTLNEVVNGIFLADSENSCKAILGMIPVGTGNDWIKTYGIPENYQEALAIIRAGKFVDQTIGEVAFSSNGKIRKRYFANMAGFGFDAVVARQANLLKQKGRSGWKVYIYSLLNSYFRYRPIPITMQIDDQPLTVNLFSAGIGIGKFNGGGMMQVPEANPMNGKFHITIIRKIGIWGILANIRGLYSGKFVRDHRVSSHAGTRITIESSTPLPGEVDGESLGNARFNIRIMPQKLRVLCPAEQPFKSR